jgi:DNA-binding transcriptional ArsR family regulator
MEILSNSRQIPSVPQYTANKQYSDLLYGYLQHISLLDNATGIRYIPKKNVKYTEIAEAIGMTRQTVSKRFNDLIAQGLIYYNEMQKTYTFLKLEKELATLLPSETVRVLCNTLKDRCLSVLSYLLKTYIQHDMKSCEVNMDIIKAHVGLSTKNRAKNNEVIKDIFLLLERLGLIKYHIEKVFDASSGGYKTRYYLDFVDNTINLEKC